MHTESEQRLQALRQVLEEKLVRRKVSLKALEYGKMEEAAKGTVRQVISLSVGISADKAREIGKFLKGLNLKGVSHQVQGDQLRVSGKKRDDLQAAIQAMRDHDFGIPLQFTNQRDELARPPRVLAQPRGPAPRSAGGWRRARRSSRGGR